MIDDITADDIVQGIVGRQQPAMATTVGNIDEDPNKAQRAIDLSRATGVAPTSIYGDLEEFERQHKAVLASDIVANNPHLSDYVQSNPMAAKISNDDYGQLDSVSSKVSALALPKRVQQWLQSDSIAQGAIRGFGDAPVGTMFLSPWPDHPYLTGLAAAALTVPELALRGVMSGIYGASYGMLGEEHGEKAAQIATDPALQATLQGLGPPGAIAAGFEGLLSKVRPAASYIRNSREPPIGISPEFDKARVDQNRTDVDALKEATNEAQSSLTRERSPEMFRSFIAQHTDAEIGISGDAISQLYGDKVPSPDDGLLGWVPGIESKLALARESGSDVSIPLADWLTHAEPEVMQALHDDIRVRPGGITANEVKLASEAKEGLPEGAKVPGEDPIEEDVPSLRAATALEPLFSVGDRKLKLQRLVAKEGPRHTPESLAEANGEIITSENRRYYENQAESVNSSRSKFGPEQGFHDFSINDENGNPVGTLNLSEDKTRKQIYVEMINGIGGLGPRDFGPALMRDLLRQLKVEFPEAETITGHRVSGAREKADSFMQPSASPVVKLDRADAHEGFQQLLEGGQWETYSPNIQAYIKPDFARSEEANRLVDIVNSELDRIVPKKVAIQGADTIGVSGDLEGQRAGESIKAGGAYIRYKETYPIILYALDGENALSAARHEAIHHLRNYGFFKPEEWSTLEAEALAGGWLSKYGIDRRYPTGSPTLKLEEAVAEAYQDWAKQKDTLADRAKQLMGIESPLDAIFRKMKAFFDGIKEKVGALLGKDPQWEDIFKKVDTGEVGGREGTEPLDARAFNEKLHTEDGKTPTVINLGERREQREVGKFHKELMGDVAKSAQERAQLAQEYHENGKLPFSVGTRFSTEHSRRNNLAPLEVMGHYVDRKDPEKYGYYYQRGDEANREEGIVLVNDPNRSKVAELSKQFAPFKGPIRSLDERLSVSEAPEGGSRVFERASALGMTVDQFKAYDKLIAARHVEDIEAAQKRVDTQQRREQTKEWKDNRRELRQDISREIQQRPDVAADLFFATGELYGQKIASGYKLDSNQLTDAQKAAIPKDYQARGGLNPDDVANIFGYGSGDAMLARIAEYNAAKKASGMGAKEFVARVTDIETDRQMRLKYGVLEDNIIDSVKEQVASETQLDILHEETVKLGMEIGQAPLDKGAVLKGVRDQFAKVQLGSFSSDRYMATAGKAGKAAELALLKGDPAEAFKAKQQQYFATALANEAIKTEKALGQFDKLAKRFSKREVSTVDQEYTNFIHDILMRVGKPVRRSIQDLETEIAAGEYKSLTEFVQGKETHGLREVPVADILLDPNFRKKFEDLTVDEFNATNDSVKTLLKNGRDEKKIVKAGVEADLDEVKGQMIESLQQFQERTYDAKGGRWMGPIPPSIAKVLRTYGTAHIQMENLFNRWDHDNPKGVFQQYVMRDLADAANNESVMEKRFASRLRDIDDKADLKKSVDNSLFKVPGTDQFVKMNRGNLRTVLMNMGNESNMSKLARGYGIKPEQLWAWVNQHATKEDWDWAQKMGDVFKEIKGEADVMYRNLSGVAPESLEIKPVQTLHGEYPGWYYPVIYHPEFEGASRKLMGKDALEQEGFVRATTPSGYTKARTGYAGPMALDLDMLPARMKQMIHDVAMRPAVISASKIFYDKDVRGAIFKHFGAEWRDMLVPYLVDVANSANYMPKQQRIFTGVSEFIRQNMISTLVGLNPGTVLKHGPTAAVQSLHEVGPINFLKATKSLFSINDRTGETNWQFAMRESDELQRRHRNYEETLGGTVNQMMPTNQFMTLRQTVQKFSATPVAISDLLSAVPTWLAQYEKSVDAGGTHGDSVFDANRAVRRAHGSTAITNRSQVMRGGAMTQWMASVYGFFNHIMNRQYELLWKAGETMDLAKEGQYREAMQKAPELTSMLFAYVLAPALIEEMVTPLVSKDNESWGKKAAKGIAFTLGASWVGVRDVASAILNGRDPSVGLFSTAYKTMSDVARDLSKNQPLSKEHAGKVIRDGTTLAGALTGIIPAQAGKTAQFLHGVQTGQERPKGPWGWAVGARFGTLKNHSGTFQEWQRHH